ncbi:SDR family NAD(P)-dependent oxidoreductase [Nocardioides sp. KC13]|uniref:SDR family NAD(P)-dependent oxidoreductase n=1 Tax=Nocardioides turkmenicus TaxID=2711220 RepID=A0A6M1QPZ6_9ACTN|nr:SDR family NAD(P)-dependent oxidoreductase [Nocardioides sp. KC13]NGN91743.1 SDR family NAD(P)-dependent oxidoreductase [Nocardioides sp. KC13]
MKVALVTGASRGIGEATARRLAQSGAHVILTARRAEDLEAEVDRLNQQGHSASALQLDVTDEDSVQRAADQVAATYGRLDVLVNNAGVLPEATNADPAEVVDLQMFRTTYETNLLGAVAVLEAFLPLIRKSEAGRIVNVTTTMASLADQTNPESPYYGMVVPAYQSSKAALNNVTIALAKALVDTPVKVTSVCPGFVQTDLTPINRDNAPITADQAAEVVHRAATLPDDAPSGTFVDADGTVPW